MVTGAVGTISVALLAGSIWRTRGAWRGAGTRLEVKARAASAMTIMRTANRRIRRECNEDMRLGTMMKKEPLNAAQISFFTSGGISASIALINTGMSCEIISQISSSLTSL